MGGVVLVTGEPGIGKTKLCEEVARVARESGAIVAWGTCWDAGGAPSYWPWISALRELLRAAGGLPSEPGLDVAALSALLPELSRSEPAARPPDPLQARFAMFEATAQLLRAMAADRTLVVIVDDVHGADPSSLVLLRFLARTLRSARVLVVATLRPRDVPTPSAVADEINRIAQETTTVALARFSTADVSALLEQTIGPVDPTIGAIVHKMTEGNPLFVQQMAQRFAQRGAGMPSDHLRVPTGTRDAVRSHLASLSRPTLHVLGAASVLGRQLALGTLVDVAGGSRAEIEAGVEEAARRGVLERLAGDRVSFGHGLYRDELYAMLEETRRSELHGRVADVLARAQDVRLDELAHHLFSALPARSPAEVVDVARRAAEQAMRALAFEDAAQLLERALALDDPGVERDRTEMARLLDEARAKARDGGQASVREERASTPPTRPRAPSGGSEPPALERVGDLWTVRWRGDTFHVRDTRGMQMLAHLVEHPRREIPAIVLDAGGEVPALGDAGEAIDDEAKAAYRARVEDLRDQLEEAEGFGDSARAGKLRAEIETIARELSAAVGLGGRSRRAAAPVERARINVQRRVRDAIRRIAEANAALGRHLDRAVRTGSYCSYDPADP